MWKNVTERIAAELAPCPFIEGVVLGGSRATGTAAECSDIDVGIYYDPESIDFSRLNEIARGLDDGHRENLICREGPWGHWVNCGGWLTVQGFPVDLILRDLTRVKAVVERSGEGLFSSHYQPGHPHAYIDVMYRGELASCRVLHSANRGFLELKRRAENYPEPLRKALISFFLFEARFSLELARKNAKNDDPCYSAGLLFRSLSALNQVLFALNRVYCLNEKKAVLRIERFPRAPLRYGERVRQILTSGEDWRGASLEELEGLCGDVERMAGEELSPKGM